MDTQNWRFYRILDNQYLGTLFQVGVVGLLSYLAIVVCGMMTAHRVIRRDRLRAPPALAAAAGCAAFGLLSATYDAAAFPQAVYSFLFTAGLAAVLLSKRDQPAGGASTLRSAGGQVRQLPAGAASMHPVGVSLRGSVASPLRIGSASGDTEATRRPSY